MRQMILKLLGVFVITLDTVGCGRTHNSDFTNCRQYKTLDTVGCRKTHGLDFAHFFDTRTLDTVGCGRRRLIDHFRSVGVPRQPNI